MLFRSLPLIIMILLVLANLMLPVLSQYHSPEYEFTMHSLISPLKILLLGGPHFF